MDIEAPECYWLPPAGQVPLRIHVSAEGFVETVEAIAGLQGTPVVNGLTAHLRRARIPAPTVPVDATLSIPHAFDLDATNGVEFDGELVKQAIARADFYECAAMDGPKRGLVLVATHPRGGVAKAHVHEPSASVPMSKCIERVLVYRLVTPSYNGSQNWLLVPYDVTAKRP